MIWKLGRQSVNQQFFNFLIGFSNKINVAQLLFDIFIFPETACDQLKLKFY